MTDTHPAFDDLFAANEDYVEHFALAGLAAVAQRGVAVVTCMDSRIEPLRVLGLQPGDAKILRNAGARVTDDVLRTLALAVHLLGVERILVMPHTKCKMSQATESEIHAVLEEATGQSLAGVQFGAITDQRATLLNDIASIKSHRLVPDRVAVGGAIYDVETGRITPLED
jgi:carbonic anhydrase